MTAEVLRRLAGSNEDFAKGLVQLGWFQYPPTIAEQPFMGKARSLLLPEFRSAGEVRGTDAWVYRLDLPVGRWQDARAIVESQIKADPQFAIVFCAINGELYIFVPENPDSARSCSAAVSTAYIRLDASHPKEFEEKLVQKLRSAPQDSFRKILQSLTTVDKVTKKFYDEFKKEKDRFLAAIEGIPSADHRRWYASVLLNRLMFIYFLQENDFLGEERNFLQTHINDDRVYYREFLMPLFLEGLAKRKEERSSESQALLGDIPYLNGGLFQQHHLETQYGDSIAIGNDAFQRMLDFFSRYTWYIRDVPIQNEKHISPDILGHIFEKYVNQKEMGAYYTKPDITGYICRNTIIPRLFDMLAESSEKGRKAVNPLRLPDKAVIEDYIYPAVKQTDYLPTETEREYKARRVRYESILSDFIAGKISQINDFITYNLDIEQFAQDFVDDIQDAEVLRAFYFNCIKKITVLDPTCGSGAFLLTAVEILYPLYDGCLRRMQALVKKADEPQEATGTMRGEFTFVNEAAAQQSLMDPGTLSKNVLADFRAEISRFAERPLEYYIHKTIIVNNLFGVDIEEEAVEICKLRLFLKLISHARLNPKADNRGIEPLPDIDFNILAGNTLVGYTSFEDIDEQWKNIEQVKIGAKDGSEIHQNAMAFEKDHTKLRRLVGQYGDDLKMFREFELGLRSHERINMEQMTLTRSAAKDELDRDLWSLYKDAGKRSDRLSLKKFQDAVHPFHWFLEFSEFMESGGFDAIVGNPPYVEYTKTDPANKRSVRDQYEVCGYSTESCNNLYAFVTERSSWLANEHARVGLIIPIGAVSVAETSPLRNHLLTTYERMWLSSYAIRPAKLFEGVEQRLTIVLGFHDRQAARVMTSKYNQWYMSERPFLFQGLEYTDASSCACGSCLPKIGSSSALSVISKIQSLDGCVGQWLAANKGTSLFFHRTPGYWIRVMDFPPYFKSPTADRSIHHIRELYFAGSKQAKASGAILSSSAYFFYFFAIGNCRNLTLDDVRTFPVGDPCSETMDQLGELFDVLMADYQRNSTIQHRGRTEFQEFNWGASKPIIDEIDRVLAAHYEFTEEELDFIINYDIKYRMGKDADTDDT